VPSCPSCSPPCTALIKHKAVSQLTGDRRRIITPPVGIGLFAVCAVARLPLGPVIRATMMFLPTLFVGLMLLTFVPAFSLWLPGLLFRR
jgi:C4-dicarboxylate transporter, DctM subunit